MSDFWCNTYTIHTHLYWYRNVECLYKNARCHKMTIIWCNRTTTPPFNNKVTTEKFKSEQMSERTNAARITHAYTACDESSVTNSKQLSLHYLGITFDPTCKVFTNIFISRMICRKEKIVKCWFISNHQSSWYNWYAKIADFGRFRGANQYLNLNYVLWIHLDWSNHGYTEKFTSRYHAKSSLAIPMP